MPSRRALLAVPVSLLAIVVAAQGCSGGENGTTADAGTPGDAAPPGDDGAATFALKGSVTGLTGAGLVLKNGADSVAVTAPAAGEKASFEFSTRLDRGATFDVTVATQPTTPSQTCVVTGGKGTVANGDVVSVAVSCATDTFTVGGTVSGLVGAGLTLRNHGGPDLVVNGSTFAFPAPVASGEPYAITVAQNPTNPAQTCTVSGGAGVVTNANVTDVVVTCECHDTQVFAYTGALQTLTVPSCVSSITVDASGAQGGTATGENGGENFTGGLGARAKGTFAVAGGDVIDVLVGGAGSSAANKCGAGGGGGSFVVKAGTLLVAAGGGGGGFHSSSYGGANGGPGLTTTSGGAGISAGTANRATTPGGTDGNGASSYFGGGGGGWLTNGSSSFDSAGGKKYPGASVAPGGGYGGGGAYFVNCAGGSGGGGGYSGGGGNQNDGCAGGGGGSFNAGTSQTMQGGVRTGDGVVTISW